MGVKDITGRWFGFWYVESFDRVTRHGARFNALCRCGTRRSVLAKTLKQGRSVSCGCSFRLAHGEASCNNLYGVYRRGAQKRGFEFTLTIEQFRVLTSGNCRYCGGSPGTVFRNYREFNGAYVYNGIDRLDNAQGYTPDNCVTCCKICNQMKHKLPVEVFLAHCARIVEYVRED